MPPCSVLTAYSLPCPDNLEESGNSLCTHFHQLPDQSTTGMTVSCEDGQLRKEVGEGAGEGAGEGEGDGL